jgi:hypothetical protein
MTRAAESSMHQQNRKNCSLMWKYLQNLSVRFLHNVLFNALTMAEGSKIEEFFYKNNLIEKYILFEKIID